MQRHWLGKSSGAKIKFSVSALDDSFDVETFTTRADTLHGVQYLALSMNHPLVKQLAKLNPALQAFLASATSLPPDTKAGFCLPGVEATNPLSKIEPNPFLN